MELSSHEQKFRFEQITIAIILVSGAILSLAQFLYNRSLWLDEAMIALNIINKNGFELLKPLDLKQVAPILFLLSEKLFSILWPDSEYGLRLLPLLCFWGSLYLFYRILTLTFKNPYTIIFSLSLFAFNSALIHYSSEVKQYMFDVLVLICIYYLILKGYKKEENKYYCLGIIGTISIFLSNVAPIILFSAGLYLLYDYLINKKHFKYIAGVYLAWGITFLLYYHYFIHGHPSREIMIIYWSKANAFMPYNPISIEFYTFLLNKFMTIFTSLLSFGKIGLVCFPGLFLTGIATLIIRKRAGILLLFFTPITLHFLLSAFKIYPVDLRLILYCCPVVIIIIAFGFDYITKLIFSKLNIEKFRLLAIFIPFLCIVMFFRAGFPSKQEEIKRSIDYIQQHLVRNDKIYVYYGASNAFKYYSEIHYLKTSVPIVDGNKNRDDSKQYINELKQLRGRNWLLFAHVYCNEESDIVKHLDSLGYQKLKTFTTDGSSAYLYDFGTNIAGR